MILLRNTTAFAMKMLLAAALLQGCVAESEPVDDEEVGELSEAICCGASCCFIGGVCYGSGDSNPMDSCEACNPSRSQSSFTPISGCGGGSDAGSTSSGGGGGDDGGCSVTAVGAHASPAALLGLLGLAAIGFGRRRR